MALYHRNQSSEYVKQRLKYDLDEPCVQVLVLVDLAPKIENYYLFRDTISSTIDQDLINIQSSLTRRSWLRWYYFDVAVVRLHGFRYLHEWWV